MELTNDFTVDVPLDQAWTILTDLRRIAPCMPGATLQEVVGNEYFGGVKVKVGPVTVTYRGTATFVEQNPGEHRAVLRAEGRETRGQGNASATITAVLEPLGAATRVSVTTDLVVTGRVAQFGRGVLADVSNKLLGQFVHSLETTVLAGSTLADTELPKTANSDTAPAGLAAMNSDLSALVTTSKEPAPVDLVGVIGPALVKRFVPVVAALALLWALWRRQRRHHC